MVYNDIRDTCRVPEHIPYFQFEKNLLHSTLLHFQQTIFLCKNSQFIFGNFNPDCLGANFLGLRINNQRESDNFTNLFTYKHNYQLSSVIFPVGNPNVSNTRNKNSTDRAMLSLSVIWSAQIGHASKREIVAFYLFRDYCNNKTNSRAIGDRQKIIFNKKSCRSDSLIVFVD